MSLNNIDSTTPPHVLTKHPPHTHTHTDEQQWAAALSAYAEALEIFDQDKLRKKISKLQLRCGVSAPSKMRSHFEPVVTFARTGAGLAQLGVGTFFVVASNEAPFARVVPFILSEIN